MDEYHVPVLLKETIEELNVRPGKKYIDATFGGGGHAEEILKRGGMLLGIDTDPDAIAHASVSIRPSLVQGNFQDIEKIATERGFGTVAGVLFDLGISSHQIDTGPRGFSYRFDAPLDLRMNPEVGISAAEFINVASEEELNRIFSELAEEEKAKDFARAIVKARGMKKIETTRQLVEIVQSSSFDKRHEPGVLSRIFQAIRMEVNDELGALSRGLEGATQVLESGGRLAVISFHSIEDRKVKLFMKKKEFRLITKKPIVAGDAEVERNPRARSAKLRVAEKL